jgi:carbonic anhydrase/acetyltransferase-like protein (isoleucine patch superfamily)
MLIPLAGVIPRVDPSAYVQQSAQVVGDVAIGAQSSVWFNAVIRGDVHHIRIGRRTNIQDNATVHATTDRWPTLIGNEVTVGHGVILHGCTIADRCLIGMGAIVMDGVELGELCMIGAGTLVPPGMKIPERRLVVGSPARIMRVLRPDEIEQIQRSAENYVERARQYAAEMLG